ncbi:MAG: hypothetical protein V4451_17065 [Pseudomonadota bacterium]
MLARLEEVTTGDGGDTCNCGTVLTAARSAVETAIELFIARDSESTYGYTELLRAEGFTAAAAALARKEANCGEATTGRALNYESLAADALALSDFAANNERALDEWVQAQTSEVISKAEAGNSGDPVNDAYEAEGWVDIALETLQGRLAQLNSNVAYGIRSLMRVSKQALREYNSALSDDPARQNDAFDNASEQLGIAIDSLDAFNDDQIDDLVLYACGLSLEKARDLLLGTAQKQ